MTTNETPPEATAHPRTENAAAASDRAAALLLIGVGVAIAVFDTLVPLLLVSAIPTPTSLGLLAVVGSLGLGSALLLAPETAKGAVRITAIVATLAGACIAIERGLRIGPEAIAALLGFAIAGAVALLGRRFRGAAIVAFLVFTVSVAGLAKRAFDTAGGAWLDVETGEVVVGEFAQVAANYRVDVPARRWRQIVDPIDLNGRPDYDRGFVDPVRSALITVRADPEESTADAMSGAIRAAELKAQMFEETVVEGPDAVEGATYDMVEVWLDGRDEFGSYKTLSFTINASNRNTTIDCSFRARWQGSAVEDCRAFAMSLRAIE